MECFTPLPRNLLLEQIEQMRHAAEDIGWRRDHTSPNRSLLLEAVKRPRIVVKALTKKLKLLALDHRVAVTRSIQLGTKREVRCVACDAQRSLLMNAGHAV